MFNKFELVWRRGGNSEIFVILTDVLDIPCFQDHLGSKGCMIPWDPTNPQEWGMTFEGQIAFSLTQGKYEIIVPQNFELISYDPISGYIPYDQATSRFRELLALLNISEKMYGEEPNKIIKDLAMALNQYIEGKHE